MELVAGDSDLVIGRSEQCAIRLPADAERVSRSHARLTFSAGRWRLTDQDSRWGTYLNGVLMPASEEMPLHEGDLIHIFPWTFNFRLSRPGHRGIETHDDIAMNQTMVRAVSPRPAGALEEDVAALLLESAAGIHAAKTESALADVVMDVATRGTGLRNVALLRPSDATGRVEIIASRFTAPGATFSRSLVQGAMRGDVVELDSDAGDNVSVSIAQMGIHTAICVPLMLGSTVAALLYLDSRGDGEDGTDAPRGGASLFCLALGRMASLALANLKRIDVERRQAQMEAELSAGAEAQRWIFPRRVGAFGRFRYIGESRPGRHVGGDFFDIIPLGEDRVVVALGDVAGKGIAASVLMTASQGFLHAAMEAHGNVGRAVSDLNRFIHPRRPDSRFLTLWVGVFDARARTLSYVDAGHGFGLIFAEDRALAHLDAGGGLPIGILEDPAYETVTVDLSPGQRVLVVSDGVIEQFGAASGEALEQFGVGGIQSSIRTTSGTGDLIGKLFDDLTAYAGTHQLADDATAVLVEWGEEDPAGRLAGRTE